MPASVSASLSTEEDTPRVKARVRRLVELAGSDPRHLFSTAPLFRFMPWLVLTSIVLTGVAIESRPQVLAAVHTFLEQVVKLLS